MEEKVRVNVYLRKDLAELSLWANQNRSQLIEQLLTTYLDADGIEDIDRQINKLRKKMITLNKKRQDLLDVGTKETTEDNIKDQALEQLLGKWELRAKQGTSPAMDLKWLEGPFNLALAKQTKMSKVKILEYLHGETDVRKSPDK